MAGARTKILDLFLNNIQKPLSRDEISRVAGVHEWARVVRALRQEGYDIEYLNDAGTYTLRNAEKKEGNERGYIDRKTRYRILQRDNSTCQRCGRTPADGVKLHIDHKIPVEFGGESSDENYWVLCQECNEGKKHWFKDEDPKEMKKLLSISGTRDRLNAYFELHPNELIEISRLQLIGGTREWTRAVRFVREETGKNIQYIKKDPETGKEGYIYKKD